MLTPFEPWLRALSAGKKGPLEIRGVRRGSVFARWIFVRGDLTASTLRGEVRAMPDADTVLATFTVGDPFFTDGGTAFPITLSAVETAALPASTGGTTLLAYDLLITPEDGTEELLFGGVFEVLGAVTTDGDS